LLEPIILKESETIPNKDHSSKFMLQLAQLSKRESRKNVNINGSWRRTLILKLTLVPNWPKTNCLSHSSKGVRGNIACHEASRKYWGKLPVMKLQGSTW